MDKVINMVIGVVNYYVGDNSFICRKGFIFV